MKKKIYLCPKCERALNFSDNPEYTFQCFDCDEDFYEFEAIVKEQSRVEGIKDFTELVDASMEIKRIANEAVQESNRMIKIQSDNIIEQIGEYIYETIKPLIISGIYKESKFRDHVAIYHRNVQLKFDDHDYGICLYVRREYTGEIKTMYFNANGYKMVQEIGQATTLSIIQNWAGFKESMNRMIPYALSEYNNHKQKELEKQKEKADIIENFKL